MRLGQNNTIITNNQVLRLQNTQANIRNVSFQAGKKVALTLFPPPDQPKTSEERRAADVGVPQVQLEQVEEDIETSILLPPYIKSSVRNQLVTAWKGIVSGQAFTGSYLEFYGQKWVYADKVSAVYDCDRDVQRSYNGETFQNVFLNKNGWMQGSKRQIFLKSKFSLTDVNSLPGWKELKQSAKGSDDVEPDIIICIPNTVRNSGVVVRKPTVFIVEMKIGLGKTDSVPEHHQLCRTKRTIEKWLDDFEKTLRNGQNTAYSGWVRPDVKLVFVGWAAPTPDKVVFKLPGKTIGRTNPVSVPYVNQNSGSVLYEYQVMKTNSEGFGHLSGVRAAFVTKIIEELNFKRAQTFSRVFSQLTNVRTNLGRQVALNRNAWLRQYGAETGPALRSAVLIETLGKKRKSPGTGVIQKLSNSINMELAQGRNLDAAIGRMLQNSATYNSTAVNTVIRELQKAGATRNNWLSLRNYILKNNSKTSARVAPVLQALQRRGVNQGIIKNIFRNNTINQAQALERQMAQAPEAVRAVKRRR